MATNETKHTPGPWHVEQGTDGVGVWDEMARTLIAAVDQPNAESNARLIAAAPEMLAALKACFANGDPADGFDPENALTERLIRAAIAKAEGKEG